MKNNPKVLYVAETPAGKWIAADTAKGELIDSVNDNMPDQEFTVTPFTRGEVAYRTPGLRGKKAGKKR